MNDLLRFRLGFVLMLVSGSVVLYSSTDILGWALFAQFIYENKIPEQLLPSYVVIPSAIIFTIGFIFYFRSDEPSFEEYTKKPILGDDAQ